MKKLKVAINCSFYIPKGGGIKEYIYNLVVNLAQLASKEIDFVFYVAKGHEKLWEETMPSELIYKSTPYYSNQQIRRSLFQQRFWYNEEAVEKFDIFHSPFLYSPKFKKAKVILTVHDLRFKVFPETYTYLRCKYLSYKVPKSIKAAEKIISISEFTKQEIVTYFGVNENKITTIHEGVNLNQFVNNSTLESSLAIEKELRSQQYILAVGHVEPRKNYVRLIEAFDKVVEETGVEMKLVIVGKTSFKSEDSINAMARSKNVVYVNFVEFSDLLWLYANCRFHVFPSYYEGFGFPSLEAAAFEKATAAASLSSLPEITGDGGVYFDPFSINDIVEKLKMLLFNDSLLKEKSDCAVANLNRFSWKENAEKTIALYLDLFNG